MAIYAMEATKDGLLALENYDGENDDMPFIQAIVLTRVQGITTFRDVFSFLTTEYPTPLVDGAITNALLKLEKRGFIKCYRDITLSTNVLVEVGNYAIPTVLGDFVNASLKKGVNMPVSEICDDLKWHGTSSRLTDATLRLR